MTQSEEAVNIGLRPEHKLDIPLADRFFQCSSQHDTSLEVPIHGMLLKPALTSGVVAMPIRTYQGFLSLP